MIISSIFQRVNKKESKIVTAKIPGESCLKNDNEYKIGVYENRNLLEIYCTDCYDVLPILEVQAKDYAEYLSKKNPQNKYYALKLDL